MSNLPTANLQVVCRNPEARRNFRNGWGAKSEGIQPGDYIDGIILGFEINEYTTKNIVMKSFSHNGQQVLVFGCSSLQNELHGDREHQQLLFQSGDVVRVTFKGSYIGKKGRSLGKQVAIFSIDELVGYTHTQNDIREIEDFLRLQQQSQLQRSGLPVYNRASANMQPQTFIPTSPGQMQPQNQVAYVNHQQPTFTQSTPAEALGSSHVQQTSHVFRTSQSKPSFQPKSPEPFDADN